MSENREHTRSGGEKRGILWEELKSLIDTLQDLQKKISAKLLEERMRPPEVSGAIRDGADIDSLLMSCIDSSVRDASAARDVGKSPQTETTEPEGGENESGGTRVEPESTREAFLRPNELSEHLKRQVSTRELDQRMGKKLQANTLEHINRALRLAKQGNREGAYIHAELAEKAMNLACEYLSEMEYEAFRRDVEEWLEAAAGKR